jgi:hypothetical protein
MVGAVVILRNIIFADVNGDNHADKIYWNFTNSFNNIYPEGTIKIFKAYKNIKF